jgi:hypothetical protein
MRIGEMVDLGLEVATSDTSGGAALAVLGAAVAGAAALGALIRIPISSAEEDGLTVQGEYGRTTLEDHIYRECPSLGVQTHYGPPGSKITYSMLIESDDADDIVHLLHEQGFDELADRVEQRMAVGG